MILRTMLQRLYAGLASGPSINARPHNSRQRIDLLDLRNLRSMDPARLLPELLRDGGSAVEVPAKVPVFQAPAFPQAEWSDEQKQAKTTYERQTKLLAKLRDISEDASDYYNDYGEHALYLGYPILSLPATNDRQGSLSNRVLAPMAFTPINISVRRGTNPGITIKPAAGGADLVQPNPGLLAWIEQQTGVNTDSLFGDEGGEEPWRELAEILALLVKAAGLPPDTNFGADTPLAAVPRTDALPGEPSILPCGVLGLFPLGNPGLLRDTKWMLENEKSLGNPVRPFLTPESLVPADPERKLPEPESLPPLPMGSLSRDFGDELLVTHADPCQTEAVAHARRSAAVVIHGPPGTGKSQTIANVIGDHLARGERVLFVCDKRTALDVVKYRLDSMGLGSLCGVIHDPQRDRKDLYLGLRERLENMTQEAVHQDPDADLTLVNRRLNVLHAELKGHFRRLHEAGAGSQTFHDLCGKWLGYHDRAPADLDGVEGLTPELLNEHRTDCEEVSSRSIAAHWNANPFRGRLEVPLGRWLGAKPAEIRRSFSAALETARALDAAVDPSLPVLKTDQPATALREELARLADLLLAASVVSSPEAAAILAGEQNWIQWRDEFATLAALPGSLGRNLDRELVLQLKPNLPSLHEAGLHLVALEEWAQIADSFRRHFAFAKKKAASEALAKLAVGWDAASRQRALQFLQDLRARHLWSDFHDRLLSRETQGLVTDEKLRSLHSDLPKLFAILEATQTATGDVRARVLDGLRDLSLLPTLSKSFQLLAQRAGHIAQLEEQLISSGLLAPAAIAKDSVNWRRHQPAASLCEAFVKYLPTLDDAVRLIDRLRKLPAPLDGAMQEVAAHELPWQDAEPTLIASALSRELEHRLQTDAELAAVDTQRIEAAFSEFLERSRAKTALVRQKVLQVWQARWQSRLLQPGPYPRLNALAANLRQRLFVRGQKAMKLRQMIAAGADTPDGDPLFDLCPVWMASPSTVAQIFPRATLFDVVVFDEASQCRLEEALPVLLRARRVVIAGDPKQLPPTRFFEKALAESDNTAAETAEELFVQQQSEAEDLLTAALNLNVQEAFLDVHYRSRNEALIAFSNGAFYNGRLQPIPGHPRNKALSAPVRLVHVDGVYEDRSNAKEAEAVAELVGELLADRNPPSIGIACFNLNQRDLIIDALDTKASRDRIFADRLNIARHRRGTDSFEGLFVKNLENVQGDERDHMIISTTFGEPRVGKFSRNFGVLSQSGGERRLNVLITRARAMVHVLTSIPRREYLATEADASSASLGRRQLYAYLRYAEQLEEGFQRWQNEIDAAKRDQSGARCSVVTTGRKSPLAESIAEHLRKNHQLGSTIYWGNDGFCVDVALTHPQMPFDVTLGVLTDFTRYVRTPDPISWEMFRSRILSDQGWQLHRVWSPGFFRNPKGVLGTIRELHNKTASEPLRRPSPEATA